MSAVRPLHRGSPGQWLDLWLALAAGRVLLRRPDSPGLRRLAAPWLRVDEPQALAEGIAREAESLFEGLAAHPGQGPLGRIAAGLGLSGFDLDLLAFAVLPCMDEEAAQDLSELTAGQRRLHLGLALRLLFGDAAEPARVRAATRSSPLWIGGLIQAGESTRALLERRLDPTETLLACLDGLAPVQTESGWRLRPIDPSGDPEAAPPASLRAAAERLLGLLAAPRSGIGFAQCVHLAGQPERAERVLAVAAGRAGALVLDAPADPESAAPWWEAQLIRLATGALVALRTDAMELIQPGGAPAAPIIAPRGFALRGPRPRLLRLDLGAGDPLELSDAWRAALGVGEPEADELAGRSWLDLQAPGLLAATLPSGSGTAAALAAIADLTPPRALRMALRRRPQVPWERLRVQQDTERRLLDLVRRVRRRVAVQGRWGLVAGDRGRSVIGLLHGESGTGKTLAAEAMATRLALPMLAVDLSLVVSKYIGETEKNLSELFSAAEGYAALLFFDEADALFGRRTNIQDAHDRYANIEVNYLLQRLESFEGCALLATNLLQGVDEAFLRRFDQVIQFPRPGVAERLAIWRTHLPAGRLAAGVSIPELAERFDLTGGEIRNAALGAAYAAADADGVVTQALIEAGVADELTKKGRPFPVRPGGHP